MATKEEIREGIYKHIRQGIVTHGRAKYLANGIIDTLHSQGVVIKVDKKCGACVNGFTDSIPNGNSTVCSICHGKYQDVAIEPLK